LRLGIPKTRFCEAGEAPRCRARRGRHAAGEDPAKRAQILEGAGEVFMRVGFDAASMNDITRAAGVSKGTIYVYFENKEELFRTIILETRKRIFADLRSILERGGEVEETLRRFSMTLITGLTQDDTIRAMRIAISVADRFPKLVQAFFANSTENLQDAVTDFVTAECKKGRLKVDDPHIAGSQFLQLCTGHIWKMRLFGLMENEPQPTEIAETAENAVSMFMRSYGPSE